jgi:hypothetical protein
VLLKFVDSLLKDQHPLVDHLSDVSFQNPQPVSWLVLTSDVSVKGSAKLRGSPVKRTVSFARMMLTARVASTVSFPSTLPLPALTFCRLGGGTGGSFQSTIKTDPPPV